jgi:hypothetical protein
MLVLLASESKDLPNYVAICMTSQYQK